MSRNKPTTLRTRLSLVIIMIFLAIGLVGGIISYDFAKDELKAEIVKSLHRLSLLKINKIENYIQDQEMAIALLASTPSLVELFEKATSKHINSDSSNSNLAIDVRTRQFLQQYSGQANFNALLLVSKFGNVIYSTDSGHDFHINPQDLHAQKSTLGEVFRSTLSSTSPSKLSNFIIHSQEDGAEAFIGMPVYRNKTYLGSIVVLVNENELISLLKSNEITEQHSEIVIATKEGDNIYYLVGQAEDDAVIDFRRRNDVIDYPVQQAVMGGSGSGIYEDYRGVRMLAEWRYIPYLNWGIVIQVRESEAFKPVKALFIEYTYLMVASVLLLLLVLRYTTITLIKPIEHLIQTAKRIISGDTSARVRIDKEDYREINELSVVFNELCDVRDKAEMEGQQVKHQLDLTIENAAEGILTINEQQIISVFNVEAEKLFGYSKEEVIGQHLDILLPEYIRAQHLKLIEIFRDDAVSTYKADQRIYLPHLSGRRKDGSIFPIHAGISKINIDGEWFFTAFVHDISDRIEYEKVLLQAKEDAEKANRAKSVFLSNMSHELRTPLHGILSFAHLGLRRYDDYKNEKVKLYFSQIEESGTRLQKLLDNLLHLSKLESKKIELKFKRVPFVSLIESVVEEQQQDVCDKALNIEWENRPDDILLECDEGQIRKMVTNIFSNAVKFSFPSSKICIDVNAVRMDESGKKGIIVAFKDEGVGIPADELTFIFDKFDQSSRTVDGAGGTGLGLAIAQEIIEAHGGKIWAENNVERGARFVFTLPLLQEQS